MYITFQEVLIMSNSIFEDALLLGVGGIVGLIAGAALMSEDDDEEEEAHAEPRERRCRVPEKIPHRPGEYEHAGIIHGSPPGT